MCWGMGEVRVDVKKGEGGDVGRCVRDPHPNTLPYTSPIPLPTSLPLTSTHFPTHPIHFPTPLPTLLHSPHIFPYSSPHPNTLPYTFHISFRSSPHLPLHPNTLPHSPHAFSPTVWIMWQSYHVTMLYLNKFNWTVEKPDKIFYHNREFKVLFRCRQCKFSMYDSVAKLPCDEVTVAKLPCGEVTGNRLKDLNKTKKGNFWCLAS